MIIIITLIPNYSYSCYHHHCFAVVTVVNHITYSMLRLWQCLNELHK